MSNRDLLTLLWSPFRKRQLTLVPALPVQMIEQGLKAPIGQVATRSRAPIDQLAAKSSAA